MTSLTRKSSTPGRIRGSLLAALMLIPAALLARAELATAQGSPAPPPITIYHSLDPLGADPRSESVPPGCSEVGSGSGGGSITVVADVNATNNPIFYANVLGSGTSVLAGRGNPFPVSGIITGYQALPGVSVTVTNTTIDATALAGHDLLIFNQSTFSVPLLFTPSELAAINTFVSGGGDVLLVAEAVAADPTTANFATFNEFLTGIGSSIQYTGERWLATGQTSVISGAPFTTGVTSFNADYYNVLVNGTTIVVTTASDPSGDTIVATDGGGGAPVVECAIAGGSYEELKLWIDGGPTASGEGETICSRDFDDGEVIQPGGNGDEICGALLTFQIQGIGRFRDAIEAPAPDAGIDTIVLGKPCSPNEGPSCSFPAVPPVKQLTLNFRRGAGDPPVGPRFLGSLIVDSTGLDPASNYSLISVFGQAAGAKLQMRSIATGEIPEVIADTRLVPEPGQLAQLLSGLFGLAGLQRLRREH